MKKHLIFSSLILIPFLASCNISRVSTPNSPFKDDKYVRVGMKGEHKITNHMSNVEYSEIKNYIAAATDPATEPTIQDINVTKYHRQQEDRDLKYAYFGKESSAVSQCTLTSISEDLSRYSNRVFIDSSFTNKEVQTANGGIRKTKTTLTDFTFASDYQEEQQTQNEYQKRRETKVNSEDPTVEQLDKTSYNPDDKNVVYTIFGLKPFTKRILAHFTETETYKFKLLGDNNDAVYGKTSDNKYVIKEGHSDFIDYSTTMGRTYKAVNNYFYEGLLEKTNNLECQYRFLDFRFYHELLILSQAFSSEESIPILYLEKPALIEFNEIKYSDITYCDDGEKEFNRYDKEIPEPTTLQ